MVYFRAAKVRKIFDTAKLFTYNLGKLRSRTADKLTLYN